ncbi:hypothetical protein LRP88_03411 [Fusarium phalaenopsidis]
MLSTLLVLLSATAGLAMPQPVSSSTHGLHQRNFTIVSPDCLRNCTKGCESEVCGMLCTISCPPQKKRADLSAELVEVEIVRRAGEDDGQEAQEFAVVAMG